jgi:hypothetical protein
VSSKKKKGFIYLLKSDKNIYKYGCTSVSIESRVKSANKKGHGEFSAIGQFSSNDIFKDECNLKWKFWDKCLAPEEFFISECNKEPLDIFIKYGCSL